MLNPTEQAALNNEETLEPERTTGKEREREAEKRIPRRPVCVCLLVCPLLQAACVMLSCRMRDTRQEAAVGS